MIRASLSPILILLLLFDCRNSFVASTSPRSLHASSSTSREFINSLVIDGVAHAPYSSDYLFWVDKLLGDLRGGGYADDDNDEYYDEYDSEEEEEEEEDNLVPRRGKGGRNDGPPNRSRPRPGYDPNYPPRRPSRKSSSSSSLSGVTNAASAATKLATKSLSMTGSLAWNALVKTPGKLAFHVIRPKHVDLVETFGLWRLDQQVIERSNRRDNDQRTITSVATVEFVRPPIPPREERGRSRRGPRRSPRSGPPPPPLVVVRHSKGENKDGKDGDEKEVVYRAPYTFVRKNKYLKGASLSSFQTSFVAPAFLVGENQRLYGYKGTWQRKLADKSVIKLKGKIHQVHKQKFGKKRGEYVYGPAVGTFIMRRRVAMSDDEYDDADESEYEEIDDDGFQYDDEEEYDEEEDELTEDEYNG